MAWNRIGMAGVAAVLVVAVWLLWPGPGRPGLSETRGGRVDEPGLASEAASLRTVDAHAESSARTVETRNFDAAVAEAEARRVLLVVRGRVIDERRFPIPGARISTAASGLAGAATSRPDGRFDLECAGRERSLPRSFRIRAAHGARHAVYTCWQFEGEDSVDAGTLVLRAAGSLECLVLDGGAPVRGALVRLGDDDDPDSRATTDATGRAHFRELAAGWHAVEARLGDRLIAGGTVVASGLRTCATLRLDQPPLRVRIVDSASGGPVAGVRLWQILRWGDERSVCSARTSDERGSDADGRITIFDLGSTVGTVTLQANGNGWVNSDAGAETKLPPVADSEVIVRVKRAPPRTWKLGKEDASRLAEGTPIDVAEGFAFDLLSEADARGWRTGAGRISGGSLVIDDPELQHFLARAPDGSVAQAGATGEGREFRFHRPSTVRVAVKDPSGRPVADCPVRLFDAQRTGAIRGNRPYRGVDARTDPSGVAAFARVVQPQCSIRAGGIAIEQVDCRQGDTTVEVEVKPFVRATIAFRVDGEPRLPREIQLFSGPDRIEDIEENPSAGLLHIRLWPKGPELPPISVRHGISVPVQVRLERDANGDYSGVADIAQRAELLVRVLPLTGSAPGFVVERRSERGFVSDSGWPPEFSLVSDRIVRNLEAGTWRARHPASGTVSDEVELAPGSTRMVTLDLSAVGR